MVGRFTTMCVAWSLMAVTVPYCTPSVQPTMLPWDAPLAELWQLPEDLASRDLYYGPWGPERAPDPDAVYTLVRGARASSDAVIVADPEGREWRVDRTAAATAPAGGRLDVVLSRVLSAVGYRQPPVYAVPSLLVRDADGVTRTASGGRFVLNDRTLTCGDDWSWQRNPFVGMKPFQGLLVILLLFDVADLENADNVRCGVERGGVAQWFVVRDFRMRADDAGMLAQAPFIAGVAHGFVRFDFDGSHRELVRDRITPEEVGWAAALLSELRDEQWDDAFRAGGFGPAATDRFLVAVRARIEQALATGGDDWLPRRTAAAAQVTYEADRRTR